MSLLSRHQRKAMAFVNRKGRYGAGPYDARIPVCTPACFKDGKPVCPLAQKRKRTPESLSR